MLGLLEGQGLYPGTSRSTGALAHPHSQLWFLLYGLHHWVPPCGPMGYNSVFTVVNRTIQQVRILPYVRGAGEISSEATAKLFFEAVVRFYGLPDVVLHDRDPCFTADFWRELWKLLGSRAVFSSACHL